MSKFGPINHFLSPVSCDSLVLQGLRCEWGAGVLNLVLSLSLSHTGHWKFNMAPHGKDLSENQKKKMFTLHKDGEGYKKIAKTLKLPGGSVMVWGRMSATGTGEQQFIEGTMIDNMYCDILKQSMIPSLRRLGRRAVFQHDNDPKHTSKMTTVLLKKLRVKVMDWPSISPDLNPIEHL